ncbi:CYTH domain-containing protein [Paracoccus liaowanqingii]|uniref:CYTH domain-containing protein n=1 Tax=Paracoccus liaowanqingii TaxID=2560053 RepID=A0A4Z1CER9_9RHOB|nr:CYTH domain-containing protein [Paracoccus liaowanqingii]TGN51045.1 CYTH domain-containing protein [Paracoccus liaowanqingii]
MSIEIERKFLVIDRAWRRATSGSCHIRDHLVARFDMGKARIRICDGAATLTLKGNRTGVSRSEFHFEMDLGDADAIIAEFSIAPPIEKRRHDVPFAGLIWQVDEYLGALAGLVTCDVELAHEDHEFLRPTWAGRDITHDSRYSSGPLARMIEAETAGLNDLLAAS